MLVVHSRLCIAIVAHCTSGTDIRTHPNRIGRLSSSLNNDICSLTDANTQHIRLVGLDGHKVVCDDFHLHAVNGKALEALTADIHNAQKVFLPLAETKLGILRRFAICRFGGGIGAVAVVGHAAVDEVVVGEGLGRWRR